MSATRSVHERPGRRARSASAPRTGSPERRDVLGALLGDAAAWDRLVDRHAGAVWQRAVDAGLPPGVAAEVCELVWLRLAQSLPELLELPLEPWFDRTVAQERTRAERSAPARAPLAVVLPLQRTPSA